MQLRVPDYYEAFHCLAGDCPHTCCTGWEVVIDEETAERYQGVSGALGEKLRRNLLQDADGDFCFAPEGGRCPFLEESGLCEIHRTLGEEATSITCQQHPRFTEDYGAFQEVTLSASCPAANALLLGSGTPLQFLTREVPGEAEEGDPWLPFLLPLRERMLALLWAADRSLHRRLLDVLLLGQAAQDLLDQDQAEDLPDLAAAWISPALEYSQGPGLFPEALRFLGTLESLESDWGALLQAAETAIPAAQSQGRLERIGAYFLFRYLLKCVNDGDLLGRVELCVLSVLAVERIGAVCGLAEALRRFSGEIEHSQENLEALQTAFRWEEALSLERFLRTLSEEE